MENLDSALILGSEGVQGEFLHQERRNWLPVLIPPLVHSLNNSLLVVMGSGSMPATEEDRASALEEYRRMGLALRTLSSFAKSQPQGSGAEQGTIDVASLLVALRCLAEPFARTQGVDLEFRAPGPQLLAQGSPRRLQQWLLCLLLGLIEELDQRSGRAARAQGQGQGVPRLRVSAQGRGRHLCLRFSMDRAPGDGQASAAFLARTGEWQAENGIHLRERPFKASSSLRLCLPLAKGAEGSQGLPAAQAPPSRRLAELTLVESDPALRELLEDLLRSERFRVQALGGVEQLSEQQMRAGLLLLDLECLRSQPDFWSRIPALRDGLKGVLLLGEASPGELKGPWAGVPCMAKACRPADLLEQVHALF